MITVEQIVNVETCFVSVKCEIYITDTIPTVSQRTRSYKCLRREMLFLALHVLIHVDLI